MLNQGEYFHRVHFQSLFIREKQPTYYKSPFTHLDRVQDAITFEKHRQFRSQAQDVTLGKKRVSFKLVLK